jgi:hypothetical protein
VAGRGPPDPGQGAAIDRDNLGTTSIPAATKSASSANAVRIPSRSSDLAALAGPFMAERTPAETEALRPFFDAVRASGFRASNAVTDERVY